LVSQFWRRAIASAEGQAYNRVMGTKPPWGPGVADCNLAIM